jgi:hypothetical protein
MTKIKTECIDAARQALNLFTGDELESYIKQVGSLTRKFQKEGIPFARNEAIKVINKTQLESLLDDSASAARNIEKYGEIKSKMDSAVTPISFLEKTAKNTDYNVETAINAVNQLMHHQSFGKMSKENLDLLDSAKIDDQVFSVADGGKHDDPSIKLMGESLKNYIEYRNSKLIQSDAMAIADMNKDRYFKNTYDQSKMLKLGRENWIPLHKSFIDVEGTFENTRAMNADGTLNHEIVDEMIGNTFDNIIEGNGVLFTRASVSKDSDIISRSRHMFYKYKDWKSWGMGNSQYGQGTLFQAWLKDISTSSHQTGMAEIMGTNPKQMFLKMRHLQVEKQDNTIVNALKHSEADALFNNLLGAGRGAFNADLANIGSSIRSVTSTARLGGIALLSISDAANVAGFAQRAGAGYWAPYINSIVNLFDRLPSDSRMHLAKVMSSVIQVHSGTISRFSDISGMGTTINRLSNKFFHGVGLHALDRGNKLSAMEPIMKVYGKQSSKSFNVLDRQQQSYLNRFNISEHEWDALRKNSEKNYFTTDNVDKLSDKELTELWNKGNKSIPLSMYRSNLYRKVFAMFDTAHEFSVLQPTAYTNMITTGNFRPGHIGGEIWRAFAQFKAYPIQYFRRVWVGGMQDFDSYQGKMMYALNQSLGTIMLAGLAESISAISKGLTPPNPNNMSRSEKAKYFAKLISGGFGVFNSSLNEPNSAKSFFFTPTVKFVRDPFAAAFALAKGDLKGAKNSVKEWANVANPIGTVPLASPYVDAFLGNKPYLEPGQKQLF